jgi:hypothetical protein
MIHSSEHALVVALAQDPYKVHQGAISAMQGQVLQCKVHQGASTKAQEEDHLKYTTSNMLMQEITCSIRYLLPWVPRESTCMVCMQVYAMYPLSFICDLIAFLEKS